MSRSSYLFAGIFGSFAVSCFALVLVPQMQLGGLQAQVDEENNDVYPVSNPRAGREIYVSEGCQYCHSQQVRDPQYGPDVERAWGPRRTVAIDYLYEKPALIGSSRIGPDLASSGSREWRNESPDDPRKPIKRDAAWHYLHLYEPTAVISESNMPPYRYLFEKRKIRGQRSGEAINLPTESGYEIVPSVAARHLVGYLLSLNRTHPLLDAKPPAASSPAAPAAGVAK